MREQSTFKDGARRQQPCDGARKCLEGVLRDALLARNTESGCINALHKSGICNHLRALVRTGIEGCKLNRQHVILSNVCKLALYDTITANYGTLNRASMGITECSRYKSGKRIKDIVEPTLVTL
jgi:hypothetical protein